MKKLFILLPVLALLGGACQSKQPAQVTQTVTTNVNGAADADVADANTPVVWQQTGNGWMTMGSAPTCPEPFIVTVPVPLADVTSVLYPGQRRPDYKPHGGFRFDNKDSKDIRYVSPIEGQVIRGGRYLTGGQIQYTFDIIHPCGMMARVGHLLELTPKFKALADAFPAATEGDSRTTRIDPPVFVTQGEQIATKVGLSVGRMNVFADFGLFDLRQKNEASKDPAYASSHSAELDQHALCWLDYLSPNEESTLRALPAGDPTAGKSSDYCK